MGSDSFILSQSCIKITNCIEVIIKERSELTDT